MIREYFKQEGFTKGHKGTFRFKGAQGKKVGLARLHFKKENDKIHITYDGDVQLSPGILQKIR
jgi:hypothetical protein